MLDIHFSNRSNSAMELDVLTLHELDPQRLIQTRAAPPVSPGSEGPRSDGTRSDAPRRAHFNLAMLLTQGRNTHLVDFQPQVCQKQTLMFVAENQVHQFLIQPESAGMMVLFTQAFLQPEPAAQRPSPRYRSLDAALQSPCLQLTDEDYRRFIFLFEEVSREYKTVPASRFQRDILRSLLHVMLMRADQLKQAGCTPESLAAYPEFSRFKHKVEQELVHTHNVKDYAQLLGVTSKSLNEWTQAVVNQPAKTFVDGQVILEIKRLLAHTDLPLKAIAAQTGFDEPTNLIKFFKQRAHQTPATFRWQSRQMLAGQLGLSGSRPA